jgi:hypothetical protein
MPLTPIAHSRAGHKVVNVIKPKRTRPASFSTKHTTHFQKIRLIKNAKTPLAQAGFSR